MSKEQNIVAVEDVFILALNFFDETSNSFISAKFGDIEIIVNWTL